MPFNFPSVLKELVCQGYSKEPQERPPIEDFKSALKKMFTEQIEMIKATSLPKMSFPNERAEQSIPQEEEKLTLDKKSENNPTDASLQLCTKVQAGDPIRKYI